MLNGFFDAVSLMLRPTSGAPRSERLDLVLLTIEELVDNGIILETDANVMREKHASMRAGRRAAAALAEQTLSQALATAKERLRGTFSGRRARVVIISRV